MPAPTTRTSTSRVPAYALVGCGSGGVHCTDRLVYGRSRQHAPERERGAAWRSRIGRGRRFRCLRGWSTRTGSPRSATSTRTSTRWKSSCSGRASGRWPAGSRRSRAERLRRVRVPRSVDHCAAHRRHGRARSRTPAATVASRSSRKRDVRERVHLPVPWLVLRPRRHERCHPAEEDVLRAQPPAGRHQPRPGAVRRVGRVRVDQPRRRRAAVAAVHRARRQHLGAWKVESLRTERWFACRLPVNWKLAEEAFVEMYHVPQTHPELIIPTRYGLRDGGRSILVPSSRRTSSTCAR